MRAEELDYDLPEALIAQEPAAEREAARLLVMTRHRPELAHARIGDLPKLLPPSLFVFNDTRVIPARLLGLKPSGGKFELLLVERSDVDDAPDGSEQRWLCMARPLKSLRPGLLLSVGELSIEVGERVSETLLAVTLRAARGVDAALASAGEMPLPPYIARPAVERDKERYQTVFARAPGAVAAPTAGLHFGTPLLRALEAAGHQRAFVTLHVGPGTFAPLSVDELSEHPMHSERYEISTACAIAVREAKREGRPVVAVGTTVVRTLEASARQHGEVSAGRSSTNLFIYPPCELRVVDALVTNFHLPRSTLLALVMAFAGTEEVRAAYREAVRERYRFFSYGDAMLIKPGAPS
ncbi:MAG: S-adenosylmethionine tRNA ribosyltransferase-isomerase [Myxococcaceae bacterium]|nr:S-adenosylmethionine tRNA ribosyltransferase-isomerase [Myxococcaceae bacterium]